MMLSPHDKNKGNPHGNMYPKLVIIINNKLYEKNEGSVNILLVYKVSIPIYVFFNTSIGGTYI